MKPREETQLALVMESVLERAVGKKALQAFDIQAQLEYPDVDIAVARLRWIVQKMTVELSGTSFNSSDIG